MIDRRDSGIGCSNHSTVASMTGTSEVISVFQVPHVAVMFSTAAMHTSTSDIGSQESILLGLVSALSTYGHAGAGAYVKDCQKEDLSRCSKLSKLLDHLIRATEQRDWEGTASAFAVFESAFVALRKASARSRTEKEAPC